MEENSQSFVCEIIIGGEMQSDGKVVWGGSIFRELVFNSGKMF